MTESPTLPEESEMTEQTTQQEARDSGPATRATQARTPLSRQRFDPREKSPGFAAFLSLAPGMGQVYVGYYGRGACIAFGVVALFTIADAVHGSAEPLFIFSALFTWAFGIIDAGRLAALYNHAVGGADAIEMPRDFTMPATGGSIGAGLLLLALGLVALSNTALGWSLAWLEDWWPLLPVGMGVYLLARGLKDRQLR